ncbi:MAG: hypothetical protein E7611_00820 [Ruminococcaceae bacterium]|nr:hypothetical protein [Oscillospiraceae bacterium]
MENGNEKLKGSDVQVTLSSPFLKWLDNFWYHHKWKVIIITFFAIVLIVGIVQMIKKEDYDIEITVATHTVYYTENLDSLEGALVGLMPKDINGDGKKNVQLSTYKIYSEEEIKAANEAETDAEGNPIIYADEAYNKEQIKQFNSYVMTGECTIMIVSEYVYNDIISRRTDDAVLTHMSDIFGDKLPEGTTPDGYGVMLYKTNAYKDLDGFKWIPDDAIICIMRPFAFKQQKGEEKYANAVEYFKNIVEFGQ